MAHEQVVVYGSLTGYDSLTGCGPGFRMRLCAWVSNQVMGFVEALLSLLEPPGRRNRQRVVAQRRRQLQLRPERNSLRTLKYTR